MDRKEIMKAYIANIISQDNGWEMLILGKQNSFLG